MKYAIATLGCKVNTYESETIENILNKKGYQKVSFNSVSDIYIINTCTVTNKADSKSQKLINRTKELNKDAITIVMGCMIQVTKKLPNAEILLGNNNKTKILEMINEYIKNKEKIIKIENLENSKFEEMNIEDTKKTRAIIKIQDGCNNFCSYCIIPYARGPLRSKNEESILEEATKLVNNGHKEIVLTGIHTGNYGSDIGSNLVKLLKKLEIIEGLKRIRISSVEITELDEEFIKHFKDSKKIVPHLHIPLQSGSNKILKLMNRKYTKEYFLEKIEKLRSVKQDLLITTDLILGFPGETQELFKETIETITTINFHKIHVFPFSLRNNTKAATMGDQIDDTIKKERVKQILSLSKISEENSNKSFLGKVLEVLIEKEEKGYYIGHSNNYLLVKTKSKSNINKKLCKVKITDFEYPYIIGEVIND